MPAAIGPLAAETPHAVKAALIISLRSEMRSYCTTLAVLFGTLGCQSNAHMDAQLELMNAERRALEDELYELEYDHEALEEKLAACQRENVRLRGGEPPEEPARDEPARGEPRDEEDFPDEFDVPELEPPTVEEGVPTRPPSQDSGRRAPQPNGLSPEVAAHEQNANGASDRRVAGISIDPVLIRAANVGRKEGVDRLQVVIQPHNAAGDIVTRPAPLSIVLLDYSKRDEGMKAIVARWKLDVQQVEQLLDESATRPGIHVELPWPDEAPPEGHLRLDVRYTAADGRKLDAREDLVVREGDQFSRRWTPRAPSRKERAATLVQESANAKDSAPATPSSATEKRAARPQWRPYR